MLVAWEQLSYAEAAQVLGCSPNAVGIRVHRARTRVREAFGEPPPANPVRETPMPNGNQMPGTPIGSSNCAWLQLVGSRSGGELQQRSERK